ncbi:Repair protein Rad1/Rec1/Rad17 containing protein [Ascosphaera apis ARSEF 7405]|uniref:Repair protein Rad1/Rec1/Rad17 containing protein n=1 Tax=Ascosphaera apis ARSEF 7405 TaxID=392613 RepID=A0A168BTM7_9EURO|nr:Repair protein Rad1/Rec1/Rad17 containing protein [Ascosphaera apis ARSEF 7405]
MPIERPLFSAVSTSTHHLYLLLRCIGFNPKALVTITPDGIRFMVEDGRVMQGLALLEKSLFENYTFDANAINAIDNHGAPEFSAGDGDYGHCRFLVSLSAFLETLQILGLSDLNQNQQSKMEGPTNAFSTPAAMLNKYCTISYMQPGAPLCTTLTESGVTTTCELTTYEPDEEDTEDSEIPLQRDAIVFKTVMRSTWLHNAITELAATNPTILTFSASPTHAPYFTLSGSGGPFSDSTVEFSVQNSDETDGNGGASRERQKKGKSAAPMVTETFLVRPPEGQMRIRQSYKFDLIHKALGAMAVSSKVSIRCDIQGVLSLQFMIELGGGIGVKSEYGAVTSKMSSAVSFIDFKFVPIVDDSDAEGTQSEED